MSRKSIRLKRKVILDKKTDEEQKDLSGVKVELTKAVSRELQHSIISIFVVVLVILSSSFAIYTAVEKSNDFNSITVGVLKIDFLQDTANTLELNDAYPMTDSLGLETEGYTFKISNTGNLNAKYKIKIIDDAERINSDGCNSYLLDKSRVKVSINSGTPFLLETTKNNEYTVETSSISPDTTKEYSIKMWIDEASGNEVLGKHYHGKILVESINEATE